MLDCKLIRDIVALNICMKLYQNLSIDNGPKAMTKVFFLLRNSNSDLDLGPSSSWLRAGIFVKNTCSSAGQGLVMAISKPLKTMYRLKVLIKAIYTVELSGVVEQITSGGVT